MRTVTLALMLGCLVWGKNGAARSLKLGTVEHNISEHGGCSLQLPHDFARHEGEYVFASDLEKHAWVNVNGEQMELIQVRSNEPDSKSKLQAGDHSTYWYAGADIEVQVDYDLTGNCRSHQSPCPAASYDAILTVKRGKASKRVAARAICGTVGN